VRFVIIAPCLFSAKLSLLINPSVCIPDSSMWVICNPTAVSFDVTDIIKATDTQDIIREGDKIYVAPFGFVTWYYKTSP